MANAKPVTTVEAPEAPTVEEVVAKEVKEETPAVVSNITDLGNGTTRQDN